MLFKADERWVLMQQHTCRLEQVGPQQPVAPFGDAPIEVLLARLLSPWSQTEVGADGLRRSEPRGSSIVCRNASAVMTRHTRHTHQPPGCFVSLRCRTDPLVEHRLLCLSRLMHRQQTLDDRTQRVPSSTS